MKYLLTLLLATAILATLSACAETDPAADVKTAETTVIIDTQPQQIATNAPVQEVKTEPKLDDEPLLNVLYTNDWLPFDPYRASSSIMSSVFKEYLGYERNVWSDSSNPNPFLDALYRTNLMDGYTNFAVIMKYEIPDEVIIEGFKRNNEFFAVSDELAATLSDEELEALLSIAIFSDKDLEVLLSRCIVAATKQFANPATIVIEDRVYPPAWVQHHTPADYARAGITPAMIQEKLPMWQEFGFADEARTAFEGKLTEFVGVEVSLARE